jgi:hypothetical protein
MVLDESVKLVIFLAWSSRGPLVPELIVTLSAESGIPDGDQLLLKFQLLVVPTQVYDVANELLAAVIRMNMKRIYFNFMALLFLAFKYGLT